MKTGDQWTFRIPGSKNPAADSQAEGDSLVLTEEAAEILIIALEQIADFPNPMRGAILISGDIGIDRVQLLHHLANLLANPDYPAWNTLIESLELNGEVRPKSPIKSLFMAIPQDPARDLSSFLAASFAQGAPETPLPHAGTPMTAEELSGQLQMISRRLAEQSIGMIVLENISERIERLNDARKLQQELQLYHMLSDAFSQNGILTMMIGKEEHFSTLESGEEFERHHTWIEPENASGEKPSKDLREHEEEFREQLQVLVYDWIQSEIPSWKPEHSVKYLHESQALTVAIPDGSKQTAGLVYFKSIFDPYWSDEDLARLHGAAYPWILMILNPLDFFYEFDSRLKDIVSRLPMLIIWHPDSPTKTELENLHGLIHEISSPSAEGNSQAAEAMKKARPILGNLYINRGRLIEPSFQRSISGEIASLSISQYLSACLNRLPLERTKPATPKRLPSPENANRSRALEWAALITDRPELKNNNAEYAKSALIDWWIHSVEGLSKKLPEFPEPFRTTRFRREIRFIEGPLTALKSVFDSLRAGESAFFEAMDHVGRNFGREQERLLQWKKGLENLAGLSQWLPTFMHSREYLAVAFPLGRDEIDSIRASLLRSIEESHRLLEAQARNEFDEKFLKFKKSYVDAYYFLHEDALHIVSGLKKEEIKIDPVSLRNLDLFSGLQYTDKSYLNRVKLLAKWVQRNQCNLPVRQILERYPRCYCNFNPSSRQQPSDSAARISGIIKDGIDYFRSLLRRFGPIIMVELKAQKSDDSTLQTITELLGDAPMPPVKPQTIKLLNKIIGKYPNDFLAEARKK
jgi:hypothetical protein